MTSVTRIARWLRRRRALRRRFNPYVVGTPVFDGSLLFGREQVNARILELLATRSVRLTGEHRMGKTSFLHHLQRELASPGAVWGFVPVFVDLEATPAARLSRVIMEETVETLALQPGTLGLRLDDRDDGYRARDLVHDVKRVVRDLRERSRADARLVFLVDEVDAVLPDPQAAADTWLDALLEDCSEELRLVLAGVNGKHSQRVGPHRERGRLEDLVLEPLHPDDARALVTKPVAHCFRYEPRAVDRIVQLAEGRPYLLQKLCLNALNRMLDEGRSTVRLVDVESAADVVHAELPWRSAGAARSA
jgi:signal transduction histidine kinase